MSYSIVVPVFNQFALVRKCLESVWRNTSREHRIVVADDGSYECELIDYLRGWVDRENVLVRRSECNYGFIHTVNEAISWLPTPDDVIVLNSDTEVPPGWVERLDRAFRSQSKVAAVCPLSNYATIFSVPNAGSNELPVWLSTDQMDRIVEDTSDRAYPTIPTVMGFCMVLGRGALEEMGVLSGEFGRGYGEEVDWCLWAREAGWVCVLCDDLFVWHQGQGSFGADWAAECERKQGVRAIQRRWPGYEQEIRDWWMSAPLRKHKVRIADRLRPRRPGISRKVLHVLHSYDRIGGVEVATREAILYSARTEKVEHVVCYPAKHGFTSDGRVEVDVDGTLRVIMNPELVGAKVLARGYPLQSGAVNVERWFEQVVDALKPDVVAFDHLAGWGTFDLDTIARAAGAEVVVAVHDEFLICPMFRLGGECQKPRCVGDDECVACVRDHAWNTTSIGDDEVKSALIQREKWIGRMLEEADRIEVVSTSISERVLGAGDWQQTRIVPPMQPGGSVVNTRIESDRLRIGYVGVASEEKGWNAFAEVARNLADRSLLEFHVIGYVDPSCCTSGLEHVAFHGAYEVGDLPMWLQRIDVAVPAVMRLESYGIVVDECLVGGCEVIRAAVDAFRGRPSMHPVLGDEFSWGSGTELQGAIERRLARWRLRR